MNKKMKKEKKDTTYFGNCPKCDGTDITLLDDDGDERNYQCESCNHEFSTYIIEHIKKDSL